MKVFFQSDFARGDQVVIDQCASIVGTVCAHCFRKDYLTIEVSWFANGVPQTHWIEEWRLSHVK